MEELVIEQGIPQDIRGKLWMTISGASQLKLQNENLYEVLLKKNKSNEMEINIILKRNYFQEEGKLIMKE